MIEYGFVAARVLSGPLSDIFKKRLAEKHADPLFVVLVNYAFIAAAAAPALFLIGLPAAGSAFWLNIALASVFDTAGMVLAVMSLGQTDLSVFGPLNAYKPAIALALGAVYLGEKPGAGGLAGVAVIIAGSLLLSKNDRKESSAILKSAGVWMRMGSIVLFCIGVIFLKKTVVAASPFTALFFWAAFGLVLSAAAVIVLRFRGIGENIALIKTRAADYIALSVLMCVLQAMTLLAFKMMFVGYALALFQLSSVISVLFGRRYFAEKNTAMRLASALIMSAGALLIIFKGN